MRDVFDPNLKLIKAILLRAHWDACRKLNFIGYEGKDKAKYVRKAKDAQQESALNWIFERNGEFEWMCGECDEFSAYDFRMSLTRKYPQLIRFVYEGIIRGQDTK